MSENTPNDKPTQPEKPSDSFKITDLGDTLDDVREKAREALNNPLPPQVDVAVEKGKSFYQRNRPVILAVGTTIVLLKINKRMVKKATMKAVAKGIKNVDQNGLPNLFDVLNELRSTPGMAYIPHGGGMVHLLKGKDAVITVFGEFDKMSNEEIWNQVANILNLGVRTTAK